MKWGLNLFATAYTLPPPELGVELEQRGFESLWLADHSHLPAGADTGGRVLPEDYANNFDPLLSLPAAAATTSDLRLGTAVLLIPEREPIGLAKQVATLDQLTGGRLILGIGAGWIREEIENHGIRYSTRYRLLRERVEAMKAIWANDEAHFHGSHVDFDRVVSNPKPIQVPHPPILMGGSGPRALECVVEVADGWIPAGDEAHWPVVKAQLDALRARLEQAGRNPDELDVSYLMARPPSPSVAEDMRESGVSRIVLDVASHPPDRATRWSAPTRYGTRRRRSPSTRTATERTCRGCRSGAGRRRTRAAPTRAPSPRSVPRSRTVTSRRA